jgi:hypothetical protein
LTCGKKVTMNWDLIWAAFLFVGTAGFVVLELRGASEPGGTLSGTLRRWLGISPPAERRWVFGGLFIALLAWFGIHILTPWL